MIPLAAASLQEVLHPKPLPLFERPEQRFALPFPPPILALKQFLCPFWMKSLPAFPVSFYLLSPMRVRQLFLLLQLVFTHR